MHPLSLCHYTLFHVPPPEFVEIAASAGFQHISLMLQFPRGDHRGFPILGDTPMRRETRDRLNDAGITLFDVSTCRLDPEVDLAEYRPMFESAVYLGAERVSVSIFEPDEQRRVDGFTELCLLLSEHSLGAGLEFMPRSDLKTLADAARLIARSGVPNAAITVDATHLHRSGGVAADIEQLSPELISYVQLCDGPDSLPIDQWGWESGEERGLPGEGEFHLHELVNVLPPDMLIGIEAPSKSRMESGLAPQEYARMAFDALQRLLSGHESS